MVLVDSVGFADIPQGFLLFLWMNWLAFSLLNLGSYICSFHRNKMPYNVLQRGQMDVHLD